jgi:nucleotide-binding universal stress UspA family protein
MFKHILIPTDGSPASSSAIQQGIVFAQEIGAKVTGIHVLPEFHVFTYQSEMLEDTREKFAQDSIEHAKKYLLEIEIAARDAGVPCTSFYVLNDQPYEAIIKAAQDSRCDLIVMATHGRKGIKGVLLGSETQKVLTHSPTPVMVYRSADCAVGQAQVRVS